MRSMLVALLLAGAALAALPSASAAQELPIGCNEEVGACVWLGTESGECVGVHIGFQGAGACADADPVNVRVCSSMRTVLSDGNCPTDALWASVSPLPTDLVVCNPDFAGVCYSTSPTGACAGANVGFQGAGACADTQSGVRVCTSMRSVLWEGFCPTDGTVLDEIIYLG
jgi:hypothetical protein